MDSEHQLTLEGISEQQEQGVAQLAHERRERTAGRARARQEREERRPRQLGQPEGRASAGSGPVAVHKVKEEPREGGGLRWRRRLQQLLVSRGATRSSARPESASTASF